MKKHRDKVQSLPAKIELQFARKQPNKVQVYHSFTHHCYLYCRLLLYKFKRNQVVIYRYSKDDGLSSKHVCKFFWNIKTAFQFKQKRQPLTLPNYHEVKLCFLTCIWTLYYVPFLLFDWPHCHSARN